MTRHDESTPAASEQDGAQGLAERVAEAMFARDAASKMLGMRIEAVAPDYARLSMTVREDMTNGHDICHGGLIFSLADSTFAFACNSDNHNTVASACHIDYLRPGMAGDVLVAEATMQSRNGRVGVFDIAVRNQNDETIAVFRGKSHRIRGEVLDTLASL